MWRSRSIVTWEETSVHRDKAIPLSVSDGAEVLFVKVYRRSFARGVKSFRQPVSSVTSLQDMLGSSVLSIHNTAHYLHYYGGTRPWSPFGLVKAVHHR